MWPMSLSIKEQRLCSRSARGVLACGIFLWFVTSTAFAHGFTADTVDIKRLPSGKYRVFISYTHLQIGEYREAHIDFVDKNAAIEAFQKLVKGAEFFRGDAKSIHFHDGPEVKQPY
jgi:hypothetical protein